MQRDALLREVFATRCDALPLQQYRRCLQGSLTNSHRGLEYRDCMGDATRNNSERSLFLVWRWELVKGGFRELPGPGVSGLKA